VLDQVGSNVVPDYTGAQQRFDSDAAFFHHVERTLPTGSAVFNLPYLFFPESGTVNDVGPYDTARGLLHTNDLKWSWGGVVGTKADWASAAARSTPAEMLDRITAVGFRGIVLDRRGYGSDGSLREYGLDAALGAPEFKSADGTLAYFDLRAWAREAKARLGPAGFAAKKVEALHDKRMPKVIG
jgi:phosphoglycerol transferase